MAEVACLAGAEAAARMMEPLELGAVDKMEQQAATRRKLKEHAVLPPLALWPPKLLLAPGGMIPSATIKLRSVKGRTNLDGARSAVAMVVGVAEKLAEAAAGTVVRHAALRELEELCVPSCEIANC